jgi:hypothetical protein
MWIRSSRWRLATWKPRNEIMKTSLGCTCMKPESPGNSWRNHEPPKAFSACLIWPSLLVAACLGCLSGPSAQAAAGTNLYQTNFEVAQGFNTNDYYLVGQGGWKGSGTGGNGIVNGFFAGQGQQAFIGYFAPDSTNEEYFLAYYPIDLKTPPPSPPIRCSVRMKILASGNGHDDSFRWVAHNSRGDWLFLIDFDNYDNSIWTKSGTNDWLDANLTFNNGVEYDLVVRMDYAKNRWSATLGDRLIASDQPIATATKTEDFGDLGAIWYFDDPLHPGDNWMLFDNYQVVFSEVPPVITSQPRSQSVLVGSNLTFIASAYSALPATSQWQFNSANILNATNWVLPFTNIQSAREGLYTVVAANSAGSVTSHVARVTVVGSSGLIYQTGFEMAQGFNTNTDRLIDQGGWMGDGTGGNGILSQRLPGKGQQAYVGYNAPWSMNENQLYAYYPINLSPVPSHQLVRFSVLMEMLDSSNDYYDQFRWAVYNTSGDRLFLIEFDNYDNHIWTKSQEKWIDTGVTYTNEVPYELVVRMDFGQSRWSAALGERLIATNQPLAAPGQTADLGDIDAVWNIDDSFNPGDNWLLFDDYRVAFELPPTTLTLQTQTPPGPGNPGSFALTVAGPAGQVLEILTSTNLKTWNAIGTFTNTSGLLLFIDQAPNPQRGFYQTRSVPQSPIRQVAGQF